MLQMRDDLEAFRQIDYLWLFNDELKFSERPGFKLEDGNVSSFDFIRMRRINRLTLTEFCKARQRHGLASLENPEMQQCSFFVGSDEAMDSDEEDLIWADDNLDEEIKEILAVYENGRGFPVDIVSHIEYFYNTLGCSSKTKNPISDPSSFPALLYREQLPSSAASSSSPTASLLAERTLL